MHHHSLIVFYWLRNTSPNTQGFEINAGTMNDRPIIENHIYLSPSCDLKLSNGIGVGSSSEEVYAAYGDLVDPKLTNEKRIAIGEFIFFLTDNNIVQSIYISTYDFDAAEFFIPGD